MLDPQIVATKATYWPELLWDNTVQDLAAASSLQNPLVNWGEFDQYNILAHLVNVTTRQQANVVLNVTADETISPGIATQLRGDQIAGPGSWVAHKQLVVQLQNLGAAAYNPTQADYGLWVWPLNDGLRYAFNLPRKGETVDQVGARLPENLRQMIDDGLRPLTGSELTRREDMIWTYQEFAPQTWTVNAGQVTPVYSKRVPPGRCYVLTAFSCDPSIGGTQTLAQQQTTALQLNISRDQQNNYLQPLIAGVGATRVIPLWIPATQTLSVSLSAAAGQAIANVPLTLTIADMPLSVFNALRWGKIANLASWVNKSGLDKVSKMVLAGGW